MDIPSAGAGRSSTAMSGSALARYDEHMRRLVWLGFSSWGFASVLACSPATDEAPSGAAGSAGIAASGAAAGGATASGGSSTVPSGTPTSGGSKIMGGAAGDASLAGTSGGPLGGAPAATAGAPGAGSSGDGGSAGTPEDVNAVPFEGGTRVFGHVLNLVNAEAAEQLASFIDGEGVEFSLALSANAFYEYYLDEYDFLFFVTSAPLETTVAARFIDVNRPAIPGTGIDFMTSEAGYRTSGRLKGAIGVQFDPDFLMPALGHEIAHYWANHLDTALGFDAGLGVAADPHWHFAGVNGVLGGFDPATLQCAQPAGAALSSCAPESNGRTRYRVGAFAPNDNTARVDTYAPLELYLMGLVPIEEVPPVFPVLRDGEWLVETFDSTSNSLLVESSGIREIAMSDVVARHGARLPAGPEQRSFSAAFVVVSAAPAGDDVLERVSSWQELFGNYVANPPVSSFEMLTGGRAKMTTRLGRRRAKGEPAAPESRGLTCDYVAQDCPDSYGCYQPTRPVCALAGLVAALGSCNKAHRCVPGYECMYANGASEGTCLEYCDAGDAAAAKACQTLCPSNYLTFDAGGTEYGICQPP